MLADYNDTSRGLVVGASSIPLRTRPLPLLHPAAEAGLGEGVGEMVGVLPRPRRRNCFAAVRTGCESTKQSLSLVIQQPVLRSPHHDLLLRVDAQLDLNGVDGVSDGDHLDSHCRRNRNV